MNTASSGVLIGWAALLLAVPIHSASANASCPAPMPAASVAASIESTVPSDLDPRLLAAPTPSTRIWFNVLTPARCPGDRFPVVFNYAAWGTRRIKTLAHTDRLLANGSLAIAGEEFLRQLPAYGYVVISADPRGVGDSVPAKGGGVQRLMDPRAEIVDAQQILDWAWAHADEYGMQTEPDSGVAHDLRLGTFGLSYGGGFQMSLAALDPRVDTIVPVMTWNNLKYSILPGDAVKLAWSDLLCEIGTAAGQQYTPNLSALCALVTPQNPQAPLMRTLQDVMHYVGGVDGQAPNAIQQRRRDALAQEFGISSFPLESEVLRFFEQPGMAWFASQQQAGQPWGFGEARAQLRPVPALFIQGNSDLLFNLTEGYWNWRYFTAAGGDTRIMSVNSGHNAIASLGSAKCGAIDAASAALAWLDRQLKGQLKGQASSTVDALAPVCISVSPTQGAPWVRNIGVRLNDFPVGSLSGRGAVPAQLASAHVAMPAYATQPQFVPVLKVRGPGKVLAGVPSLARIDVTRSGSAWAEHQVAAYVATGIRRNGSVFAVDQQVTGFAEGSHTRADRTVNQDDRVLLPAVGEVLHDGDELGLILYPQSYLFSALISAQTPADLPLMLGQVLGSNAAEHALEALSTLTGLVYLNPYDVQLTDIQLPVLVPGAYPHSRWSH